MSQTMDFEAEISRLPDTLVVVAEIQRRQAEQMAEMSTHLLTVTEKLTHTDTALAEITDKLNGLIGVVQGFIKRPPKQL